MARINVEDTWWVSPRRSALIRQLNGNEAEADGSALKLWRIAQDYENGSIPKQCFELIEHASKFIQAGMVEVRTDVVYVKGSTAQFDWLDKKRAAARLGGLKSAEMRLKKHGTSQPITEAPPKQCFEPPERLAPNSEPSSSSSSSSSNKKKIHMGEKTSPLIEELYKLYPKRKGHQQKKAALKIVQKVIEVGRGEDLRKAILNYAADCRDENKINTTYVQQFKTFMSQTWEEWITPPNGKTHLTEEEKLMLPGFAYNPEATNGETT